LETSELSCGEELAGTMEKMGMLESREMEEVTGKIE